MSTGKSNDPLAALHNRYGLIQAAQSLPQRLTTTEIAALAYPDETYGNDRFQFALMLGRAIERGELEACGTAAPPAYLTTQGVKHGPRPHLIDRAAFARFLTVMDMVPCGRLAEWLPSPGEPEKFPVLAGLSKSPGRPSTNAEAYHYIGARLAAGETNLASICLDAATKYYPNEDSSKRSDNLAAGYRQLRRRKLKKSP